MAEREATIVIKYVSDTADAKAAYDNLRKYAEQNPIGVKSVGMGSRVGETATFAGGGGSAPAGGLPGVRDARAAPPSAGEQGIYAAVSRMHSGFGGSGFAPATGPVPTAHTNTFYGDATRSFQTNPYGVADVAATVPPVRRASAEAYRINDYERYYRQALASGIRSPVREEQFGNVVGRSAAYEELADWRFERQQNAAGRRLDAMNAGGSSGGGGGGGDPPDIVPIPINRGMSLATGGYASRRSLARTQLNPAMSALRQLGGVYAGVQIAESGFRAANQAALAQAQAAGDPFAMAQAAIANDPYIAAAQGIPLVGGLGAGIYDFVTKDQSSATYTMRSVQQQQAVSGAKLARRNDQRDADIALRTAYSGLAGSGVADIMGVQGRMDTNATRRLAYQQESEKAAVENNTAKLNAEAAARAALTPYVEVQVKRPDGSIGFASRAVTFDADGMASTSFAGAEKVNASDHRRLIEFNRARGEAESARQQLAKVKAETAGIFDAELATDRVALARVGQSYGDATRLTIGQSTGAFRAGALRRGGDSFGGTIMGIEAQFWPQIQQADTELDRLRGTDRSAMSDEAQAALDALIQRTQADRNALNSDRIGSTRDAGVARIGQLGDVRGGYLEQRGRMEFDPYGGQLSGLKARYDADMKAMGPDGAQSEEGRLATSVYEQDRAAVLQQQSLARIDTSRGLGFEGRSIERLMARDAVGASGFGIAGQGIDRIQSLARGGMGDLAERARGNTLAQLDLAQRDYGFSFRAVEADPRNLSFIGPRDSQDPGEVIRTINEARAAVRGANADEGIVSSTSPDGSMIDYQRFEDAIEAGTKRALEASVVN